jgi:hypothetical protein
MAKRTGSIVGLLLSLVGASCAAGPTQHTWHLERVDSIGGHATEVVGHPVPMVRDGRKALCFDGKADGVFLPVNPVEGWPQFTVEVLFRPDGDGNEEQRFLHIQDEQQRRALIETRVTKEHTWALDTFLHASDRDRLTLLDRARTQATDRWYWAALVYDGKALSHYVNGVKQLEGEVAFPAMARGRISLGVRQNKVHWFKGCIAEVRFTAGALGPEGLKTP